MDSVMYVYLFTATYDISCVIGSGKDTFNMQI